MDSDRNIIRFELADSEFSTFYSLLVSVELRKDRKELTLAFYHFGIQIIGEGLKNLADGILEGKIRKVGIGKSDGDGIRMDSQYSVGGIKIIKE